MAEDKKKSCFWSHDWGNWGEPGIEDWVYKNRDGTETTYEKLIQYRKCKRCSKIEKNVITTGLE